MTDNEEKYVLLGLTEDKRSQLVHLAQLALLSTVKTNRVIVETVVVHDGDRVVIAKEERSA